MSNDNVSNYGIAFLSVILFSIIGMFTIGLWNGIVVGIIIGLLVSILIALERIYNLLKDKSKIKDVD